MSQIDGTFYRVDRRPNPLEVSAASAANTRFADPQGEFAVTYVSDSGFGALVEALQWFRPDLRVARSLSQLEGPGDSPSWIGLIPLEWFRTRALATLHVDGNFVDLGHSETLARLRVELAEIWAPTTLPDLDAGTIRLAVPRAVTQAASRYVYEQRNGLGRPTTGLLYRSRFGDDITNLALQEPFSFRTESIRNLDPGDQEVQRVCGVHGLAVSAS